VIGRLCLHMVRMLNFVYASSHCLTVQGSDNGNYSHSDGDSYTEDGSESGDGQYGVSWMAKL
jgi:hypothetical protein